VAGSEFVHREIEELKRVFWEWNCQRLLFNII